jgi:hypothetical protein
MKRFIVHFLPSPVAPVVPVAPVSISVTETSYFLSTVVLWCIRSIDRVWHPAKGYKEVRLT